MNGARDLFRRTPIRPIATTENLSRGACGRIVAQGPAGTACTPYCSFSLIKLRLAAKQSALLNPHDNRVMESFLTL